LATDRGTVADIDRAASVVRAAFEAIRAPDADGLTAAGLVRDFAALPDPAA
jgi:hypothetical protein